MNRPIKQPDYTLGGAAAVAAVVAIVIMISTDEGNEGREGGKEKKGLCERKEGRSEGRVRVTVDGGVDGDGMMCPCWKQRMVYWPGNALSACFGINLLHACLHFS